jgi:membrane protease YdiL (CAAX protease family)
MSSEGKSALILGVIVVTEGAWCVVNWAWSGWRFVHYLGFAPNRAGAAMGWAAALLVVLIFVALACRLPSVRANLIRPSLLKLLALGVAVAAGILEEVMFRKWVMDWLHTSGYGAGLQILGSAISFGAVHAIWGLMGKSLRAASGAMLATSFLGGMLAVVYLLAERSLAPCIAAHFLINVFIEPGLVLAATRGEMGRSRSRAMS